MNGLEVSAKILKLSNEIGALDKIMTRVQGDRDFSYEYRVVDGIKKGFEREKAELENKLRSISF